MTEHIRAKEQAKLIRKALKEAFPDTKFYVRMTGGSAIDVTWYNGPTKKQVETVALAFEGGYFDGMNDYRGGHIHIWKGEEVRFGADFVFCHRRLTEQAQRDILEKSGLPVNDYVIEEAYGDGEQETPYIISVAKGYDHEKATAIREFQLKTSFSGEPKPTDLPIHIRSY